MLILPLRAVLFQILFVMLAIAVETPILQRLLFLPRPLSVRYAAVLNLMSTTIGWGIFFIVYFGLPETLKAQFMGYVFFGQFFRQGGLQDRIQLLLPIVGVLTFFGTAFVEWLGLKLLLAIQRQLDPDALPKILRDSDEESDDRRPVFDRFIPQISVPPSEANALLAANALSYTLIAFLLVVRYLERVGFAA